MVTNVAWIFDIGCLIVAVLPLDPFDSRQASTSGMNNVYKSLCPTLLLGIGVIEPDLDVTSHYALPYTCIRSMECLVTCLNHLRNKRD